MSAVSTPPPAPAGAPEYIYPESLPPRPKWSRVLKVFALVIAVGLGAWVTRSVLLKPQRPETVIPASLVRTVKVVPGPLERVVRLAGETAAVNYASITVPILRGPDIGRDMVLVKLAEPGSFVKKGEVIAQIDAQAAKDHIDDVEAMVLQAESDIKKRIAEQAANWESLQQTLRLAKADFDKAQLDYSVAEVRTPIERELLKLTVEESEARYKQLQEEQDLRKASDQADLRVLEITRDRQVRHLDRHVSDLKRFTFVAPMSGLVVMQTFRRAGEMSQIELGDQVRSGQTFMKVVNTSAMELQADTNQADGNELRVGQEATILLDAFPGVKLKGHVYSIGALAVGGWRENYYIRRIPVTVRIEGSDPRLIPDLSASADVVIAGEENVLAVPSQAVYTDRGKKIVYVKKGESFEPREVKLGMQNATHAVVTTGLEAGEEVALERPPQAS
jgi:HlyD family secretion protein